MLDTKSDLQTQRNKQMNDAQEIQSEEVLVDKKTIQKVSTRLDGSSPFGMNRKFRRALFSAVKSGNATENDVERFKSLGKDAYPWMAFSDVIEGMKNRSMPTSKHTKAHKIKTA